MPDFVRMTVTSAARSESMSLWSSDGVVRTWRFHDLFQAASAVEPRRRPVRALTEAADLDRWFVSLDPAVLRDLPADALRRIDAADLSSPLMEIEGVGLIDGSHRLAKAHLTGEQEVLVVALSVDELLAIPHSDRMVANPE